MAVFHPIPIYRETRFPRPSSSAAPSVPTRHMPFPLRKNGIFRSSLPCKYGMKTTPVFLRKTDADSAPYFASDSSRAKPRNMLRYSAPVPPPDGDVPPILRQAEGRMRASRPSEPHANLLNYAIGTTSETACSARRYHRIYTGFLRIVISRSERCALIFIY